VTALARLKRRADRAFYRLLFGLYRVLFPNGAPRGRLRPGEVRRVLILRQDAVGDMIVTTPALAYLRAALPRAEIDVVASRRNASLLDGDPRADRVYVNDFTWRGWARLLPALRRRRYDVVFALGLHRHLREGLVSGIVAPRGAVRASWWRPTQYAGLFTHVVRAPVNQHITARLLFLVESVVGDAPPARRVDLARFPMALAADAAAEARVDAFLAPLAGAPYVALNAWATDARRSLVPPAVAEGIARSWSGTPGSAS
jgi:ADP-heptose:LPS heptosyltransferase